MRRSLRLLLDGEDDSRSSPKPTTIAVVAATSHGHAPAGARARPEHARRAPASKPIGTLRERAPDTQIVVITMDDNPVFAQRALRRERSASSPRISPTSSCRRRFARRPPGEEFVSPRVAARLDALHRSLTDNKLTPREVEVLRLIALGHTSVEIARKLHLSPRTVETHRAHIHSKLGLATRAELVRYALRRGLIGA